MKIIYLLPPSEGKNSEDLFDKEELSFEFEKPYEIGVKASEKDLKCSGNRFIEGILLNKNINNSKTNFAINRYTGVMYNAIDYKNIDDDSKKYFNDNFFILSGMYGILKPNDKIGNYKLPIETKGLYKYWKEEITNKLNEIQADLIVDLLPNSYKKMFDEKLLNKKVVQVNFLQEKNGKIQKVSHGVKKIKGEFIKNICIRKTFKIENLEENLDIFI